MHRDGIEPPPPKEHVYSVPPSHSANDAYPPVRICQDSIFQRGYSPPQRYNKSTFSLKLWWKTCVVTSHELYPVSIPRCYSSVLRLVYSELYRLPIPARWLRGLDLKLSPRFHRHPFTQPFGLKGLTVGTPPPGELYSPRRRSIV